MLSESLDGGSCLHLSSSSRAGQDKWSLAGLGCDKLTPNSKSLSHGRGRRAANIESRTAITHTATTVTQAAVTEMCHIICDEGQQATLLPVLSSGWAGGDGESSGMLEDARARATRPISRGLGCSGGKRASDARAFHRFQLVVWIRAWELMQGKENNVLTQVQQQFCLMDLVTSSNSGSDPETARLKNGFGAKSHFSRRVTWKGDFCHFEESAKVDINLILVTVDTSWHWVDTAQAPSRWWMVALALTHYVKLLKLSVAISC